MEFIFGGKTMTRVCDREDYDPGCQSITMRQAINKIKKLFPNDKVEMKINHHEFSGFVTLQDGRILYMSSSDERYFKDVYTNMLVRSAQHTKDWTGGSNNWFNLFTDNREQIINRIWR